jgi:hypothetical protein
MVFCYSGFDLWIQVPMTSASAFFDPRTCKTNQTEYGNIRRAFVFVHDLHMLPDLTELKEALMLVRHFHPSEEVVFLRPGVTVAPAQDGGGRLSSSQPTPIDGELAAILRNFNVTVVSKAFPKVRRYVWQLFLFFLSVLDF